MFHGGPRQQRIGRGGHCNIYILNYEATFAHSKISLSRQVLRDGTRMLNKTWAGLPFEYNLSQFVNLTSGGVLHSHSADCSVHASGATYTSCAPANYSNTASA